MSLELLFEELKIVIDWIKFADTKSAFIWTIYLAITWALYWFKVDILSSNWGSIFFYIGTIILLIGYIFLILSVLPRTKNNSTKVSLLYYGTISNMTIHDFSSKILNLEESELKLHLSEQISTNSTIASKKMLNVKYAIYSLAILVLIWLIFLAIK